MKLMGILNVTPDSFSDGNKWLDSAAAVAHARDLIAQGAEIIDVGGESTRPGAQPLSAEEEWLRIGDIVAQIAPLVTVSVDTYHAQTARRAVEAGAQIVNDVTGGRGDDEMWSTVAELECDYVLQHSRGDSQTMNALNEYPHGLIETILEELSHSRDAAVAVGIAAHRIILDPGLGFAKVGPQDWEVLGHLDRFNELGHRVLVGHSRKRFLGPVSGVDLPADQRDVATAYVSGFLAQVPVWAARVHNVAASRQAVAAANELRAVFDRRMATASASLQFDDDVFGAEGLFDAGER